MMRHAEAETLAAFVDGTLDREELAAVTSHLATCEECRGVVGEAAAFEREEMMPIRRRNWMPAAAAVVVLVAIGAFTTDNLRQRGLKNDSQKLLNPVDGQRAIAGRFSGQEMYGKKPPVYRNANESQPALLDENPDKAKLQITALKLRERTENARRRAALRARAIAEVISGMPAEALATLKSIPPEKRDATIWNDISVVATESEEALAAADAALAKQPNMHEALFNRALILHDLGDKRASAAWDAYLKVDSNSAWAEEARENQRRLREQDQ